MVQSAHCRIVLNTLTGRCSKQQPLREKNIKEYAETVISYIAKCAEDVTVVKTFTTHNNQKLWMTAEVRLLLKARDAAFRGGD